MNADGRFDLAPGSNLFGGLGFSQEHEDRGSPDAVASTETLAAIPGERTVYTALTTQGGVVHPLGDTQLRAGATFEQLDYDDVPSLAGSTIDSDYRDRRVLGLAGWDPGGLRPGARAPDPRLSGTVFLGLQPWEAGQAGL